MEAMPVWKRLAPVAAAMAVGVLLAACGGGGEESTAEPGTTADTTSVTQDTGAATTGTGVSEGDPQAGEQVFASAGCGGCHTLAAAGSSGAVGPNLDELGPDFDVVVEQVTNGGGGMPAFGESLSEQQIEDVAAYVVQSTAGTTGGGTGGATDKAGATSEEDDSDDSGSGDGEDDDSGSGY